MLWMWLTFGISNQNVLVHAYVLGFGLGKQRFFFFLNHSVEVLGKYFPEEYFIMLKDFFFPQGRIQGLNNGLCFFLI